MEPISLALITKLTALAAIDFYMVAFGSGLVIRYGWIEGVPAFLNPLAQPESLWIFGALYFLEHFAEKIPVVAVTWNWVHAAIKPFAIAIFVAIVAFQVSAWFCLVATVLAFVLALVISLIDAKIWTFLGLIPIPLPQIIATIIEDIVVFLLLLKFIAPGASA